jgi:hypothetical protein
MRFAATHTLKPNRLVRQHFCELLQQLGGLVDSPRGSTVAVDGVNHAEHQTDGVTTIEPTIDVVVCNERTR